MTLKRYIGNPGALSCTVSGVQLYISPTLLGVRERQRNGSVWVACTRGGSELSALRAEKGKWKCQITWPVDLGRHEAEKKTQ
jgi:hypothetical protein